MLQLNKIMIDGHIQSAIVMETGRVLSGSGQVGLGLARLSTSGSFDGKEYFDFYIFIQFMYYL